MPHNSLKQLEPWITPPFVQDAVLEFMRANAGPHTMAEIARAIDVNPQRTTMALLRLHNKNVVSRYRLPMQKSHYVPRLKTWRHGAATHQLFVYSLIDEAK